MTNMSKMEAAEKIISQEGECVGLPCSSCPSETEDGNCIIGNTVSYVDADSYMKNKTEWFQKWMVRQIADEGACHGRCSKCPLDYCGVPSILADERRKNAAIKWLKTKEVRVNNDAMLEKIEELKRELAELKTSLKQKNEMVFDARKSYVGIDADGDVYYLVGSGADEHPESATVYRWHDLGYNMALTWDGVHATGQDALDSVMEDGSFGPWTIHEFTHGTDALEFYLGVLKDKEE